MSKFKKNDKVIVAEGAGYDTYGGDFSYSSIRPGRATVVSTPQETGKRDEYTLTQDGMGGFSVLEKFLTSAEPFTFDPGGEKIAFGDVEVGDHLAALTYGQWRIGEVKRRYMSSVEAGEAAIAYDDSDTTEIRLLHRPEPEVDPAQVAAVREILLNNDIDNLTLTEVAEALVEAGVTINTKEDA